MLNLPSPIQAFYSADTKDSEAIAERFTENATVEDDGGTHIGQQGIREWVDGMSREFTFTSQPQAVEEQDGEVVVTCLVSGTFPGSPITLFNRFRLEGDRIASLSIYP